MTDQELSDEQDEFEKYRADHIAQELAGGSCTQRPRDSDVPTSQPPKGDHHQQGPNSDAV